MIGDGVFMLDARATRPGVPRRRAKWVAQWSGNYSKMESGGGASQKLLSPETITMADSLVH
jgi:hypothetical protein